MGYDLILIPVDRALTWEEALPELRRLGSGWRPGLGHDRRLDPFLAELRERYPGIGQNPDALPVTVDVGRKHIALWIAWPLVEEMVPAVAEMAWGRGLAVLDPQREAIGLPAPLADAPLGADGLADCVASADRALGAMVAGMSGGSFGEAGLERALAEQARSLGARMMSPLGFEITEDIADEVGAHPDRVPMALQTPTWRDELLNELAGDGADRHRAVATLGGWAPDPTVASGLRTCLSSDDVFLAGFAAIGLARQGDTADLPALLEVVRRFSPSDGGTADAMLLPLQAALDLAAEAGPGTAADVKRQAREWRGTPRRSHHLGELDAMLDELLAE